jgi:CubicO group peptidase (beta-lactamase class C family)
VTIERTRSRITKELEQYSSTLGVQLTVVRDNEPVIDLAVGDDGTGRPITTESLFRVYCTIKPVLATIIAGLVEDHLLCLDTPLQQLLGDLRVLADGTSLRHLLNHTAGLARPMAFEMEVLAPERRRPTIEALSRPRGFQLGVDAAYSEYAAWHIAGWAVESVTDAPLGETMRAWLDALELHDTHIGMTSEVYEHERSRIGMSHDLRAAKPFPMALEPRRRWCTEINPAHGGYTTTRNLATFYAHLQNRLSGGGPGALAGRTTLEQFCRPTRPKILDPVLDRPCRFGLGFMAPVSDHAFGEVPSPSSFGHSGYAGASFAFADPEHNLAIAATFNGIVNHNDAFQRRVDLLRAIYEDLGLLDSDATDANDVAD